MTHADELISQQRDEPLGPAEDLFVRHHVAECQECRAFSREVESADRLLRGREPYIAVPPLRVPRADAADRRPAFAAVAVLFLVLGLVLGTTLGDLRTAEQEVGTAAPIPLGASLGGLRAGMPWRVALGDSAAAVLAKLGEPVRRVDQDRQWVYGHGVVVFFDVPASSGGSVWRITAWLGSGASTEEGFGVHQSRGLERFREVYADHDVIEDHVLGPLTRPVDTRFPTVVLTPFVVLTVSGRDREGDDVTVWASVSMAGEADLLQIFRGRPEQGRVPAVRGQMVDPQALSACEVIARAAVIAGYERGGVLLGRGVADPFEIRHCAYLHPGGELNADLDLVSQPIGPAEVPEILAVYTKAQLVENGLTPEKAGEWRSTGPGQWLLPAFEVGYGYQRSMAAVLMEPYFFIVQERDDERAQRLAAAVREVLLRAR